MMADGEYQWVMRLTEQFVQYINYSKLRIKAPSVAHFIVAAINYDLDKAKIAPLQPLSLRDGDFYPGNGQEKYRAAMIRLNKRDSGILNKRVAESGFKADIWLGKKIHLYITALNQAKRTAD